MKRLILAALALALALSTPLTALAQNATVGVPAILNGNPVTISTPYTPNADGTYSQQISAVASYLPPVAYTSGTVLDFRAFGSIVLDCPVAPTAIVFSVSPDPANAANVGSTNALIHPIALTAVQNNAASGITTTSTGSAVAEWSVSGHKFAAFTITGGTCFIYGGAVSHENAS